MNRLSRVYTSLSNILIVLAIVCAPLAARATTVATPVISLAAGTYTGSQTVTITDSTSGSKIYYTLGTPGTTPTTLSTVYTGPITVSSSETLEAMATATGDTQSGTATAAYTILGTLQVYLSGPGVQSTSVAGASTETFDALSTTNPHTTAYVSTAGIGTYTGSSSQPFAIEAPGEFGGATDSTHTSSTNYFAVGGDSGSTSPVYLTLTNPVSYFGFWWSAGDQYNTVALYSGSTLYGTFTTANLLTFLNHGTGTITANSGAIYNTSAYFGNPNITGTNDSTEPFAYISFVISGATINQIAFYNTNTSTSFESDNHSAIFSGNTVTIPTTFVPVESMSLGTQSVSVSVSPASANVKAGGTQQFTATVVGSTNTSVTWSISPATGAGTISSSGLYTAPATVTTPQTVTITATSAANTSVKAPVIVNLLATPTVSVWPTASAITYGQTLASSTLTGGTTSTPGTFTWTTPGTAPGVGTASQSVTFTPTASTSYSTVTGTVNVTVAKATPTVSAWPTASGITYGQTLASSTLTGGTASVAGTFAWTTPTTVPGGGTAPQSVTFTPTASTNYTTVVGSVNVTVSATPLTITASSATVTYGAAVPTITPSFSGFVNGQTSASLTTQPTCITAYTPASAAGSSPSTSCSGAVDANYTISYVAGAVTVSQAALTITASSATVTYGAAVPTITPSFSGFVNGQTSVSLTTQPTCITAYTTTSAAGSSPSTSCSGAVDANYSISYMAGAVTVSQAALTITASSATVTYGAAVPTITPSFSGFVNGQTSVSLTTQPTCITAYTTTSAAGSSPSTSCSGAVDANYTISYVAGAVTVSQAALTITASSATVTYGAAVPTITPSFSGFVNGQTSVSLTTQPTCITAYTTTSAAGSTPSTSCSGAVDANYTISYVAGTVTVNKAPLTITASSATVTYGAAVPTITPSFSGFVNGQTSVSLTTQPTCITAYTTTSAAGSSPSTSCSGAVDANYSISYMAGTVTVTAAPSYTLAASPASLSIVQGSSGSSTITVTGANGFSGSVTLAASGLPSGVTAAFATNPTTGSSVLTLTASGTATVGTATVTVTGTSGSLTASTTVALTVTAPQCAANGYIYQRAIVIDHTKVPNTDQTNFPFLFNTIDPAFASTSNNGHVASQSGDDIIFSTDPNGFTKLDHELEEYNPQTGQVIAWVRIPTLSHTADTVLYMFYGNPSIGTPQQNPTGVWDSNFGGVWHLGGNGPVSSTGDSTANGNNGTVVGSISQTIGEIGNGIALSGSPNYIDAGNSASVLPTHTGTFSVWVNYNAFAEWTTPMGNGSGGSDTNGALFWNYPGGQVDFEVDGSGVMNRVAGSTLVTGQWYYLTGSWDGSTVNFYENGALVGNAAQTTDASPAYHLMLGVDGALSGSGYYLNGSLNEARVSGIARSPDWIATEYSNESSPATFYTFSPEGLDNTELVTPSTVSLYAAQNQQFAMLGVGTCSSVAVGWTISPVVGTISATGLYSAPATISAQQTVTITATNQANNTSASATVTLMSSSSGPAGTVVTINGAGFGSAEGASSVTVGGLPAVTLSWTDTQIQAQIPTGTGLGIQAVVVTVGGQTITNTTFNVTSGLTGITPSAAGTQASLTIDTTGQQAVLIFSGVAGQTAYLNISNSTFAVCAYYSLSFSINNPNGSGLTGNSMCGSFAQLTPVVLPTTGTYTVAIAPQSGSTGSANVNLWLFNNLVGTITSGTPVPVTINIPDQEELLTFSGVGGQTAYLNISNSTFAVCDYYSLSFSINNPNGSNLAGNSMCGSFAQLTPVVLPTTGTYTVAIAPQSGSTGSANVNLWLFNNLVGTITSGTPVPVTINIPDQEELLTFSGVGGQTAYLNISNSTFAVCDYYSLSFSINNPNGSNLAGNSMCGSSGSIGPLVLPTNGTYTIVVAPQSGSMGSATVSLTLTLAYSAVKMSASLVPSESSLGSPVAVNLTLTANNGAQPPGTVSCAGAGVTSSQISVNPNGTAVVPMNGLPLGNDAIICSYVSIDPASFSNAVSFPVIESVAAAPVTGAVSVNPASVTLYAGQSQQFGASVFNTSNQAVTWSLQTGAPGTFGTLTASGLYTAPGSIASQQTVAITAIGQASGASSGTAIVTLLPAPANPKLTLVATAQPPYVTGTSQTFAVTLTNQDGTPIADESVAFTVTGANNNTGSAITNSNGVATYAYTGANSGNDTIQTTASISGEQVTSNKLSAVWIVPSQPIATTSVLGQFFFYNPLTDAGGPVAFNTLPTAVPAFTEEFPNICFNPPIGTIPGNTTIGVGTHPFTDVTTDENGNFTGTIVAQGNGYQAGLNEQGNGPDGLIQNQGIFQAVFTGSYVVASAGDAVINVYVDNTFILGIGGGATSVSGPLNPGQTTTPFEQLPVMGAAATSIGGYSMTVYFPGPGTYPYELDYVECCGEGGGDTLSLMMSMGLIGGSGLPPAGALTITPGSLNPLPAGGQQAFTVQAIDASGNPVPNLNVTLEISGVDSQELKATTNASGSASFTYQDVNPGTASVQAVALIDGMVTFSSQVSVPWTLPPSASTATGGSGTLAISIAADSSVSLPNALQLTGTATDSGLPAGSSPAMTWTGSGPGTVTFAPNPNQASVAATFSLPGSYVVQLSASDSVPNSGSVQWPVTVNPPQQNLQGWIGSPLYGSAVSGVVPITVASGTTLQSGTLTYYSASNPNSITTLNANTTGSGQIGALDTTTLVNGSYWIQLQAVDTSSQQQYSLVLVTVSGNYKPGRVTATVTDLVVPATGLAINIQRNYDSLNAATSSDFGYGWSLGINVNLAVDPVGNVTFTLGGQRKTFYLAPQPQISSFGGETFEFWPWFLPAYTPEPGLHGTLTDGGSGCIALDFLTPNGNLWSCAGAGLYNPTTYIYTDPNGTAYTISAAGSLQSIKDLSGNGLTITANGITSTTGLSVPFVRDPNNNNRITKITDPAGNIYQYGYDTNGNLATVTYPVSVQSNSGCPGATASGTSTYTYDPTFIHLYAGGTDGRGCPLPTSTYYNSTTDNGNSTLDGRLLSSTDAFSNTTSYAYNLSTTTTTITYPDNNHAIMVYDSFGDLLQSTDPNNITTTNTYDANHNLTSVTVPRDATTAYTTSYTYDANGNKTSSTYPATATSTNTTSYTYYNQYSEPTSTIDELGNVRFFNYDTNFLPQSVTDNLGTLASFVFNPNSTLASGAVGFDISANPAQASQFTYDANGNMASRTDALGRTTSYVYNSLGQKTSMTAPTPTSPTGSAASTTTYGYDAMGNLTSTAAPLSRNTSSTYDANGNKLSDTDARGNTTNYIYDALNRLVETDYPSNATTPATKSTKSYDFRNNVIDEIDQAGNDTHHVYDPAGRQTSVTRGYGSATTAPSTTLYTYYNDGRKATETDPANNVTNYTYDAAGRLTSVTGAQGTTTYAYDDDGNQISRADGKGNTTQFQYDARKRLIQTTYPDTTTTINTYDGPGNLASVTDQAGNVVEYTYDAANQLKTVVQVNSPNAPANTNSYGYDPLGDLTGLSDERSDTTQNLFDQYGEPTQKTLPAAQVETRTYDGAGNLAALTHFNQVTTTYAYDALNRLLTRATPGETTVSFTYTATGKYLTSTAQDGTVNYTYDALDRLMTKATPEGTLSYTYFPTGKVETITSSNPHGVNELLTYDDQNRLSTVVDNRLPGNKTTSYSYDNSSNVATVTYPNGLTSTFTYDALNRLTELATPPVADYKYTLGLTGLRSGATEQSGRTLQWSYDNIYRLTNETITGDPANNGDNNGSASYTLDPVGNRTAETSSLSGINPIAGSYNPNDQLSSESYDANGNTTHTANGNSYTYDSENHMASMTNGSTSISLIYDAFGNRVAKTVNGVTTQYLVEDDVNPTGYPQVVEELSGPIGSGVVTRQYTYGLQRISENLSPAVTGNSTWTAGFYGYDGFGSVRQLTNSAGTVTDSYEYDAFGNSFTKSGTTPNNYLYRGEQYDADLGLYYLRARYYNPLTGRFLSRDPEEGNRFVPATLHKYLYVGGDPINFYDPTGRNEEEDAEIDSGVDITFGHGARHLLANVTQAQAEAAFQEAVQEIIDTCVLNPGTRILCVVSIGLDNYLVKAFVVTAAWVNIGTYYPL